MSLTDEPADIREAGLPPERPDDDAPSTVPTIATLRWPIVQALRDVGQASDAELVELVADSLKLTDQQRAEMIPSEQETRLKNRVSWAAHELKQIGAVYYPAPSFRALTALGNEIDDDQIRDLHRAFEAEERRRKKAKKKGEQVPTDTPTAWLIRAGGQGELAESFIENKIVAVGFGQLGDLSEVSSRDKVLELVKLDWPESSDGQALARANQLWALSSQVHRGDVVVMPSTNNSGFALGTVTEEYSYRHDAADTRYHAVSVEWKPDEVPRTALQPDLLKALGLRPTVNMIRDGDHARRVQQLLETGLDPGPQSALNLPDLVKQFYRETGYPTEAHKEQRRLREEWAKKLSRENILSLSREDLHAFTSNAVDYYEGEYVKASGNQSKWIRDLDDAEFLGLLNNIKDLCWGEDELSTRIDRLAHYRGYQRITGTKGFSGSNVGAALAICLPHEIIPTSSQNGKRWGRNVMLRRLGLPDTPYGQGLSFGSEFVDANDRLRTHLAPQFKGDTQAMGVFLHWLVYQDYWLVDPGASGSGSDAELDFPDLADRLLIDAQFLTDIVSLLKDKGQVILYGPPGTGKTFLARELAKELAPEESCRALVQFHPSTTYEDFFEGYRPAGTGDDGGIRYKLTPGPLKRMAKRARNAPDDKKHVMIIDEINRGNLPSVLGELLFLLEYRDESVETLYRPKKPFSLPDNLWFIGTMNTADRSIALVDAALRRRFHFVPFFPNRGPMAGLLGRWLAREGEPAWIGHLVDAVNNELKEILEGSHLLLGPSHFMKEYGSSLDTQRERLRRIWEYNIEPFIEDQFFGDPQQIDRFRFDAVMRRNGPLTESDVDASDDGDDLENTDGSDAAAEGDAAVEPGLTQPEGEG